MDFGGALELLKRGEAVGRESWNEDPEFDEAYIYLVKGNFDFSTIMVENQEELGIKVESIDDLKVNLFEEGGEGTVTRFPSISLMTDQGIVPGYVVTNLDLLSEDWYKVEFN